MASNLPLHLDSTAPGFTPFWERCADAELATRINRLKRGVYFCRGRAADLQAHVVEHIKFLEGVERVRFYAKQTEELFENGR